jgi:hypothetical protein
MGPGAGLSLRTSFTSEPPSYPYLANDDETFYNMNNIFDSVVSLVTERLFNLQKLETVGNKMTVISSFIICKFMSLVTVQDNVSFPTPGPECEPQQSTDLHVCSLFSQCNFHVLQIPSSELLYLRLSCGMFFPYTRLNSHNSALTSVGIEFESLHSILRTSQIHLHQQRQRHEATKSMC